MSPSTVEPRLLGGKPTIIMHQKHTEETKNENTSNGIDGSRDLQHLGRVGLLNFANNCYLNAVVQILANIQEVKQLFLGNSYVHHINKSNSLGSGGKIANSFADTINALWDSNKKHTSYNPRALKTAVSSVSSAFSGFEQCDAQEFLSALLDGLHEDMNHPGMQHNLNVNKNKTESESSHEWQRYLHKNNSPISKQFHGQLMSVVTCKTCDKVSKAFDPFAQISLPVSSSTLTVSVVLLHHEHNVQPISHIIKVPSKESTVSELKTCLNVASPSIDSKRLLVFKSSRLSYDLAFANDDLPVKSLLNQKHIVVYQMSNKPSGCASSNIRFVPCFQQLSSWLDTIKSHCGNCAKASDGISQLNRCTGCFGVAYCSQICQRKHWKYHKGSCVTFVKSEVGLPFILDMTAYTNKLYSWHSFIETLRISALCSVEKGYVIKDRKSHLEEDFIVKMYKSAYFDGNFTILSKENFKRELAEGCQRLCIEWRHQINTTPLVKTKHVIGIKADRDALLHLSIADCLQVFKGPENLSEKDGWKCPKCKAVRAATKELFVTHLPDILFLHLKRFSYSSFGQKMKDYVVYPLSNFDMSPYTSKDTSCYSTDCLYDLIGVVSHLGSMQMGHYTCMTRLLDSNNQELIGWRYFDDDYVDNLSHSKVVCPNAYLLMYRKRTSVIPLIKALDINLETPASKEPDDKEQCVHYPYRYPLNNKSQRLTSLTSTNNTIHCTEFDLD